MPDGTFAYLPVRIVRQAEVSIDIDLSTSFQTIKPFSPDVAIGYHFTVRYAQYLKCFDEQFAPSHRPLLGIENKFVRHFGML